MAAAIAPFAAAARVSPQLQTAQREARQAELTAQSLRRQADAAQRSADQEQTRADGLKVQSDDASSRWDSARGQLQNVQASRNEVVRVRSAPSEQPFMNSSGQATGLLLHELA